MIKFSYQNVITAILSCCLGILQFDNPTDTQKLDI